MEKRNFLKMGGLAIVSLVFNPISTAFGLEGVVGKVSDKLNKNPIEGANLKLYSYPEKDFIAEYTTDSSGNYNPTNTGVKSTFYLKVKKLYDGILEDEEKAMKVAKRASSGIIKVDITHEDYVDAIRYFDSLGNNFDATIAPKSFDMSSFDSWTRSTGKGLQKWGKKPDWKINVAGAERTYVDLVKEIISNDITYAMNWNNPIIQEIETAENIEEPGKYLVYWTDEDKDNYGNHNENLSNNNEIISASTWFLKSNKMRRIFLRQLTQGLGFVRNTSSYEFYTPEGYYTPQGKDMLTVLCSMNAGNISPDTDSAPA